MEQELMDMSHLINNVDALYKVQYIKVMGYPINVNSNPEEPFFVQPLMDYDKYELPTVLPFHQFDMLLRPLKSSAIFKQFIFLVRLGNLIGTAVLLLIIFDYKLYHKSFGWLGPFLWIYLLILHCTQVHLQKELQIYCLNIRHQTVHVKLVDGIESCCFREMLHFKVRSKVVEEDGKRIKLYLKQGGDELISVGCKEAIFQKKDLLFDQRLLDKIVTFQEFQQQIRAFKDNEAHKACVFWKRIGVVLLFLMVLDILLIINDPKFIPILLLLIVLCWLVRSKKSTSKSKMVYQLQTFCQNVSLEHERIQVVAHLREVPMQRWCLPDEEQLYCFEIKLKDLIHS